MICRRSLLAIASVSMMCSMLLITCSHDETAAGSVDAKPRTSRAELVNTLARSTIEFTNEFAQGTIGFEPGSQSRLMLRTVTTNDPAMNQTSGWWIDDKQLTFEGPELRIGDRSFGKLEGKVEVLITKSGVLVNGENRGRLE